MYTRRNRLQINRGQQCLASYVSTTIMTNTRIFIAAVIAL